MELQELCLFPGLLKLILKMSSGPVFLLIVHKKPFGASLFISLDVNWEIHDALSCRRKRNGATNAPKEKHETDLNSEERAFREPTSNIVLIFNGVLLFVIYDAAAPPAGQTFSTFRAEVLIYDWMFQILTLKTFTRPQQDLNSWLLVCKISALTPELWSLPKLTYDLRSADTWDHLTPETTPSTGDLRKH